MPRSERPAADFITRSLPLEIVDAGITLFRSHARGLHPIHFSVGHPKNRYDDPDEHFGVCYCAQSAEGAFAETFLRTRTGDFVDEAELKRRCVAELKATRPLRLVRFYGPVYRVFGQLQPSPPGR